MSIKIENTAEAMAAVACAVIAADGDGSLDDFRAAFVHVKNLEAFRGLDEAQFTRLLGNMTGKLFNSLPMSDDDAITREGVTELMGAVRPLLDAGQRAATLTLASAIGGSSAGHATETLIDQVRRGLNAA